MSESMPVKERERVKKFLASLLVLLGAASFGLLSTIVKFAYHAGFNAEEVTSSQILFGFIVLWLISLPAWPQLRQISKATLLKLVASGTFTGLVGIFYYYALQSLDASFGVILLFQFVWMGFLVDWLISQRRPTRSQGLAIIIVLLGTVLAAGIQSPQIRHISLSGVLFGLLAAASYTGSITVNARIATEVPAPLRSALFMTGATIITLLVYPPHFLLTGTLFHGLWPYVLLLGLFGVVIPPYLFAIGMPQIGPALASILGSVELPVVILCSHLFLHEQVTPVQVGGVLCILGGIVIAELHTRRKVDSGRDVPSNHLPRAKKFQKNVENTKIERLLSQK
jgi:Predicted permease, DMT superfamily